MAKALMSHTFFVKFKSFLKQHCTKRIKYIGSNFQRKLIVLFSSIFRVDFLVARLENEAAYANKAIMTNKDSIINTKIK